MTAAEKRATLSRLKGRPPKRPTVRLVAGATGRQTGKPTGKVRRMTDPDYLAFVRRRPCAISMSCPGPTEAHHTKTKGSGGGDDAAIPLCWRHHREFHDLGRNTFSERFGVDLAELVAQTRAKYGRWLTVGGRR